MKKVILFPFTLLLINIIHAQNVGIGTDMPMAKLEIKHNTNTQPTLLLSDSFSNHAGQLRFRSLMPAYFSKFWGMDLKVGTDPKDYELGILTDNTNVMKLYGTGNITIGNIFPQARLSVKAYPDFDILNITGSADEPALKINASRNIGIKNAAPTEALDIAGNMRSDTVKTNVVKIAPNAGTGKILTSDAVGNATWQSGSAASGGNIGYGVWGDCATTGNIGDYYPVAMEDGNAGDGFGEWSVSIDGDYAIIGAWYDTDAAGIRQGSASIYRLVAGVWIFQTKFFNTDAAAYDYFGYSVCIKGDYAAIAASNDDDAAGAHQGSVSIYHLVAGVWTFQTKLLNTDAASGDAFGSSVAINGNYLIIGAFVDDDASGADEGSASIYHLVAGIWTFQTKLLNSGAASGDGFGRSVSIDGDYAIIGASYDDDAAGTNQGSASIYHLVGGVWTFQTKLLNTDAGINDYYGWSVSINGDYAIVGAWGDDDVAGTNQGSASIYHLVGGVWILQTKLFNTAVAPSDLFGVSVSIRGDFALIGASLDDGAAGMDQGSAVIYKRLGNSWQKYQQIFDPAANAGDTFGTSIAIDAANKRFLVGVAGYNNGMGKAVFGKIN